MANDTSGSVWALDTAATIKTFNQRVKIISMYWRPNATNDDLDVRDGNGNAVLWLTKALTGGTAGAETWHQSAPVWSNGLKVETIDGGTLYVHVG